MQILYRKTFNNCSELPLLNFIKILTKEDYRQLFCDKDNWRLKPNLQEIWDSIFMEFAELSNDKQGEHIFSLIKEMQVLKGKLELIQSCIDLLAKGVDLDKFQETINTLRSLSGSYLKFNEETLLNDLKVTATASKRYVDRYQQLLKEYKEISNQEQAKATEIDYMERIAFIKETLGISFDIRTTTVIEYLGYMKRLETKLEKSK